MDVVGRSVKGVKKNKKRILKEFGSAALAKIIGEAKGTVLSLMSFM